jgi:hypothetical protein
MQLLWLLPKEYNKKVLPFLKVNKYTMTNHWNSHMLNIIELPVRFPWHTPACRGTAATDSRTWIKRMITSCADATDMWDDLG